MAYVLAQEACLWRMNKQGRLEAGGNVVLGCPATNAELLWWQALLAKGITQFWLQKRMSERTSAHPLVLLAFVIARREFGDPRAFGNPVTFD